KRLFLLTKINLLTQLQVGEYIGLIAAADFTHHSGISVLLESCLADKLAFVERTRRLILPQQFGGQLLRYNGIAEHASDTKIRGAQGSLQSGASKVAEQD